MPSILSGPTVALHGRDLQGPFRERPRVTRRALNLRMFCKARDGSVGDFYIDVNPLGANARKLMIHKGFYGIGVKLAVWWA
jgi:hypothetical protein